MAKPDLIVGATASATLTNVDNTISGNGQLGGGQLALIWNRLRPTRPTRAEFESIYRDYMNVERRSTDGNPDEIVDLLTAAGFTVTQRRYPHDLRYSAQQWVDIAFTFSHQLILPADKASELRARLIERIGSMGVAVGGDAVAILATPA